MNFEKYKVHCSSTGSIMTNQQGKKDTRSVEEMSETCKSHLIECYIREVYGREKDITNKYVEKGLAVEEDSLTLYSRLKKRVFFKNEETFSNEYLVGTPDIITEDTIIDIKSSWDVFTFFSTKKKPHNKMYYYQLQGYMALTGKSRAKLAYCLIDTPDVLINQEKERLLYKMGVLTRENPDYLKACDELERNMKFDDIPMSERLIEFPVERDPEVIDKLYARIELCREYLINEFSPKQLIEA